MQPPKPPPIILAPTTPGELQRQIHHRVELGRAHLEVVAQTRVRSVEQFAELRDVAGFERPHGCVHTLILADDVPQPSRGSRRQLARKLLHFRRAELRKPCAMGQSA
ncbi:MAG: hypothetical protein ACRETX_08920, partial [Steroidobacteraceae bacterium]